MAELAVTPGATGDRQLRKGPMMNRRDFAKVLSSAVAAAVMLPSASNADALQTAREAGVLRVAMSGQYPPFNFVDADNNVTGLDAELARALAERIGLRAEIVTTAWDGILAGLIAGRYDAIIGSMTITDERRRAVDFVGPYYHAGRAVFVPVDSSVQSLDDLSGRRVGATLGETHERWARAQSGWRVRSLKGLPELLLEVGAGRVDAIVQDDVAVWAALKTTGDSLRKLDTPSIEAARTDIGIAIRKDELALHAALQNALDAMRADGSFAALSRRWIGTDLD